MDGRTGGRPHNMKPVYPLWNSLKRGMASYSKEKQTSIIICLSFNLRSPDSSRSAWQVTWGFNPEAPTRQCCSSETTLSRYQKQLCTSIVKQSRWIMFRRPCMKLYENWYLGNIVCEVSIKRVTKIHQIHFMITYVNGDDYFDHSNQFKHSFIVYSADDIYVIGCCNIIIKVRHHFFYTTVTFEGSYISEFIHVLESIPLKTPAIWDAMTNPIHFKPSITKCCWSRCTICGVPLSWFYTDATFSKYFLLWLDDGQFTHICQDV